MRSRRRARDPLSFAELRRLADDAQESEEARAVLHDALLERFPEYGRQLADVDARSDHGRVPWNVWFFPTRLNDTTRKHGTTYLAFEGHRALVGREDLRGSRSRMDEDVNRAVIVYETVPTKFLRYVDESGNGRGVVVDMRDGRVMGQRLGAPLSASTPFRRWGFDRSQNIEALDTAFLRWMHGRLLTDYSREALIDWLSWNDRNGAYTDEEARREGQPPLTHAEAAGLVFEHVVDTKETPEEMRRSSRRW